MFAVSQAYFLPGLLFLAFLVGRRRTQPSGRITATERVISINQKRWFAIYRREDGVRVWPDATIRYCFENDDAKARLLYSLEAAINRWYLNGLPEEKFKLTEVSATECQSNRANVLLIKYNDIGILYTTPGLLPLDEKKPNYKGPTMQLSDNTDVGLLETISNFAHEIGHTWGLMHEHQHPSFWSSLYTSSLSQIFTFNCRNPKDYAGLTGRLPDPADQHLLCTDRVFVDEQKFGASDYLPLLAGGKGPFVAIASDNAVDWDPIILYPSGAGGTGSASPGNDQRLPVILKASDGSRLPINLNPSTKDVNALKLLYTIKWPTTRPTLLNEPSNPKHSKFKTIFGKHKCV